MESIVPVAAALASVAAAAPPGAWGYHSQGMTDATGFIAKGCVEILVHGWDVTRGLGVPLVVPDEICAAVVRRLFPWVPDPERAAWDELLWITGRVDLPGRSRQDDSWVAWHPPLDEWDGTIPTPVEHAVAWVRDGTGWRAVPSRTLEQQRTSPPVVLGDASSSFSPAGTRQSGRTRSRIKAWSRTCTVGNHLGGAPRYRPYRPTVARPLISVRPWRVLADPQLH